jgi:glycosyltransferase involved in cell wall biosynthesis
MCNNSRAGAADYGRWLGNPKLDTTILHNGIDFGTFESRTGVDRTVRRQFGIPEDVLLVASVMRISEEKQPLLWARVAIEISRRRPDVHFALIGDGPLRAQFEQIVTAAQIDSRVHLLGSSFDVPALLQASDLFLLTSRVEGLPNVLLEAQAVGLPAVTTPAGGAAETLDPGRTGLVTPDHTVRGIADACLALLDDDILRASMAQAGPDFVRRHFSLEQMFAGTLRLYEA